MKFHSLVVVCCMLAGCKSFPNPDSFSSVHHESEDPSDAATQISVGKSNNSIVWDCHQEDVNDHHIWITCQFMNMNTKSVSSCIDVAYSRNGVCSQDNPNGIEFVAAPKTLCTGELQPGALFNGYTSYYEWKSVSTGFNDLIRVCGKNISGCTMQTFEISKPIRFSNPIR